MPKVPLISDQDAQLLSSETGQNVLDLSAAQAVHMPCATAAILMKIEARGCRDSLHFALSPPMALQLSRALRKAVKDYLVCNPETESHSAEDRN